MGNKLGKKKNNAKKYEDEHDKHADHDEQNKSLNSFHYVPKFGKPVKIHQKGGENACWSKGIALNPINPSILGIMTRNAACCTIDHTSRPVKELFSKEIGLSENYNNSIDWNPSGDQVIVGCTDMRSHFIVKTSNGVITQEFTIKGVYDWVTHVKWLTEEIVLGAAGSSLFIYNLNDDDPYEHAHVCRPFKSMINYIYAQHHQLRAICGDASGRVFHFDLLTKKAEWMVKAKFPIYVITKREPKKQHDVGLIVAGGGSLFGGFKYIIIDESNQNILYNSNKVGGNLSGLHISPDYGYLIVCTFYEIVLIEEKTKKVLQKIDKNKFDKSHLLGVVANWDAGFVIVATNNGSYYKVLLKDSEEVLPSPTHNAGGIENNDSLINTNDKKNISFTGAISMMKTTKEDAQDTHIPSAVKKNEPPIDQTIHE